MLTKLVKATVYLSNLIFPEQNLLHIVSGKHLGCYLPKLVYNTLYDMFTTYR